MRTFKQETRWLNGVAHPSVHQVEALAQRFLNTCDGITAFGLSEALYALGQQPLQFRITSRHKNHVTLSIFHNRDSMVTGPRTDEWMISGDFNAEKAMEWLDERHVEWHLMTGMEAQARLWL
jgi:hypothetical protein